MELAGKHVQTDIDDEAMAVLGRRAFQAKDAVLSHGIPEEMLFVPPYSPEYNNLYVFIPKSADGEPTPGDWSRVQQWVEGIL
jgi:hypothetical protein